MVIQQALNIHRTKWRVLKVNYRDTDLNLQLLTIKVDKDEQSFTSDDIRDYVLQLREIDDTLII